MKKLGISLLCCVLVLSGCFLFAGCGNELEKYDELKEILFELQMSSGDSYSNSIYVTGEYRWENSSSHSCMDLAIPLNNLIIDYNCLIYFERDYYFYYYEITQVKGPSGDVIWRA